MERRPRWSESPLQAACEPQNAGPRPWTCGEPAVRAVRHAGHAGVCLGNARSQRPGHLHSPSHPHQIPAPKLQLAHPRAREVGGGAAGAAKECLSPCWMPLEALRTRDAPMPLLAM